MNWEQLLEPVEALGWPTIVAGRLISNTCSGARLTGVTGPSSAPLER